MKRDRFALNFQAPHRTGFTLETSNDKDTLLGMAGMFRRDLLRKGVRITIYDIIDANNVYDIIVSERDSTE